MGDDFWKGCRKHEEWEDGCSACWMNRDVYENEEMYKAMADSE